MTKVEAVVLRERVETVIDAVEEQTGHVGVTVVEAVGHGRQRGITHEYRGRVFESRFLPKAMLTFIVKDEIADLLIAASTIWVVITAVLVMFMQAGFAFLEAGLTRMKNAGHIAGKNVLIFGLCSVIYWMVGFGIAFGDGGWFSGTAGFFPSVNELISVGQKPFDWFSEVPGAAGYLFEVVFAGVSLAIVWGAMAERAKLWVYFAFGAAFTLIYSVTSHWIWHSGGWLYAKGMQDLPARPSSTIRARSLRLPGRCCSGRGSGSSARTAARIRSRDTTCRTPSSGRSSSGSAGSASTRDLRSASSPGTRSATSA